jgi:hypothetical protein
MKSLVCSHSVFFILFSFSILFVSCSHESAITSPNENNAATIAKTAVVPTSSINHSKDTVITLPKSGKTLVVGKNTNTNQLALLDTYLQTHTVSDKPATTVSPMAGYYTQTVSYWELQNDYQPVSSKYIGIWCDYLTPAQCYTYGFNQYAVSGSASNINQQITQATSAGFVTPNIMILLPTDFYTNALSIIANTTHCGYYFIDEPVEQNAYLDPNWIPNSIAPYLHTQVPSAKLFLSSFRFTNSTCWAAPTGGTLLRFINSSPGNVFIMCDKYSENCCGNTTDWWSDYHNFYGNSLNPCNWMSVTENDGTREGDYPCAGWPYPNSSDFSTLLGYANNYGMNNTWLFACGTGNEAAVLNFSFHAWATGWMLRQEKYLTIVYQCSGLDCNWTYQTGTWTVKTAYYTTTQYVPY